jgi:hypothetical protein
VKEKKKERIMRRKKVGGWKKDTIGAMVGFDAL